MVKARLMLGVALSLGAASCGSKPATPAPGEAPAAIAPMQPGPVVDRSGRPAADAGRGEPVAWLKDRYLYAGDVKRGSLRDLIAGPLFADYVREHRLEPTAGQIASFLKFSAEANKEEAGASRDAEGLSAAEAASIERELTAGFVKQWLLDKSLYEKYGGRVIFQQMNPMEPVGAYRAFLEEHERRGTFEILDAAEREKFWSYYTSKHSIEASGDQIDFSRPWWEQTPGEGR